MRGSDLEPIDWPVTVVQGDTWPEDTFTLSADGTPVTVTASLAQVRTHPGADVAQTIDTDHSGGSGATVVGPTVVTAPAGPYVWALKVTSTELGVRTIAQGAVTVLPRVAYS